MDNVSSASIMECDSAVDTAMYEDISRSSGDTITAQGAGQHKPAGKPAFGPCFRY
jgi:hypothetical protein